MDVWMDGWVSGWIGLDQVTKPNLGKEIIVK